LLTNQVWQLQPHGMKWGCSCLPQTPPFHQMESFQKDKSTLDLTNAWQCFNATDLCHGTQYESKQEWKSEFCWREERGWMEVHIGASLSPFRNQISMMLWPQDMNHETACHENQCSGTRSSYFLFAGVLMMFLGFPHSHKWSLNIPGRCLLHIFILSFLHLQCSWSSGWDNNLNFLQKATTRQAKATCMLSWWCLPTPMSKFSKRDNI
jgi:hypothetical protein